MSNQTIPAGRPVPVHPSWCDPRFCEVTEKDVNHRSAPRRVQTIDAIYELSLERADEYAFPTELDRAPELRLHLKSNCFQMEASAFIAMDEVPALIGALAAQLAQLAPAGGAS